VKVLKLAVLVTVALAPALVARGEAPLPVTGRAVKGMASFDRMMVSFMRTHGVPGGALAVVRDRRIVYARGFGYADPTTRTPVQPDALFRIASVSKPITSAAIMRLVERGKLSLDERVFDILRLKPVGKGRVDPRLKQITVRHLLLHTGGWDRRKSFDPMFRPVRIAESLNTPPPARADQIARAMLTVPLDSAPGTRYAYSNFGYCLLGRIIEAKTGVSYEQYVRTRVLAPIGITRMRIGRTLRKHRADGEVTYVMRNNHKMSSVFGPDVGRLVPGPYGGWHLEAMDAHGGWIASAIDLVRFAREFDAPKACRILTPASISATFARPPPLGGLDGDRKSQSIYYAFGWQVRVVGKTGRVNTWHAGALGGSSSLLVRRHDGLDWAVLLNMTRTTKGVILANAIDPLVHRAAAAVTAWPETDILETGK